MPEVTKQPLPSGPTTLCFNKEEFMKVRMGYTTDWVSGLHWVGMLQ